MANALQELVLRIGGDSSGGQQATRDLANALANSLTKALKDTADQSKSTAQATDQTADAITHATAATGGWLPLLHEMGTSWVARIAEGILLRDAIHEIIGKVKEMIVFLPELVLEGSKVAGIEKNFDRLTEAAGLSASTLMGTLRAATHNTVTDFELMKRVNQDLAAGMNLSNEQFNTLAKGAYALAKATGKDVKEALDTMSDAMLTGRTRSLALLTGKISQTSAEEAYAKSLMSSAEHLTDEGKLEASREAILKAVGAATERLGTQTDGLGTVVKQVHVWWTNFQEDLGKTIAASPVLKAEVLGIRDAFIQAFGGSQEELIKTLAGKVDDAALSLAGLARAGVNAGGALATEWYALEKVFGNVAQIIQGNALAFEYLALGVAKTTAAVNLTGEGQRKAAADVERIQSNITSLLMTMKARGDALQEADRAQAGVSANTEKYLKILDDLQAKIQSARAGTSAFVGPLEAEAAAHEHAGAGASKHAGMLQQSKQEMSDAAKAAKEIAAAHKEALDALIPLTAAQQVETASLLALGVSHESIAIDIGATEVQVRAFVAGIKDHNDALKTADEITKKFTAEGDKHWKAWFESVAKSLDAANKKTVAAFEADLKVRERYDDDVKKSTLTTSDYQVAKIEEWRDKELAALDRSGLNWQKHEAIIKETARKEIQDIQYAQESISAMLARIAAEADHVPPKISHLSEAVDGLSQAFYRLGQMADGGFGRILSGAGQALSVFSQYQAVVEKYGAGSPEASRAKSQAIQQSIGVGAGLVSQTINDGPGASTGSLVAKYALQGASAGSVGGWWGMGAGAAAGAAYGWYESGKEWRKAVNDVSRDFGNLHIPEDFANTIEEIESTTGLQRTQALTTQLAKLIEIAGGLKPDNFNLFFSKLHDAFSYVEQGTMTVAQVTQVLDSTFAEFARVGTDAYGRINDQVRELIELDQRFGTHSQAIADWMKGQVATMASGLNDLLTQPMIESGAAVKKAVDDAQAAVDKQKEVLEATKKGSAEWKKATDDLTAAHDKLTEALATQHTEAIRNKQALDDLGEIALTTFNAALASGDSFLQALEKIAPALSTIRQAYADLGLEIEDATLKGLTLENTILRGTPDKPSRLGQAIGGFQAGMTAAMNLGPSVQTPEAFAAQQRQLAALYTQTQAAAASQGVTGPAGTAAALLPFQQVLHEMEEWAKKNGQELSADTQEKIRQSKELNLWNDDYKSDTEKTRDSMADIIKSNDALAAAIGGLPQALADVIAGRHPTPPPGAPPPPGATSPPGSPWQGQPWDPNSGGYAARGGLVTARGVVSYLASGGVAWPWPKGTDTVPAMLTPGEFVLTAEQQQLVFAIMQQAAQFRTLTGTLGQSASSFLAPRSTGTDSPFTQSDAPGSRTYNVTVVGKDPIEEERWLREWMRRDGVEITVEEVEDGRFVSRLRRKLGSEIFT